MSDYSIIIVYGGLSDAWVETGRSLNGLITGMTCTQSEINKQLKLRSIYT